MPPERRERIGYGLLAGLLILVAFATLGSRPLFNPDEGRYAEIPREMLVRHDFVIPHINGLAYIEKPPLQFWATALALRVFGQNEFAARLYTALCALGCVLLVGWQGARSRGWACGWRAAFVLTGMLLFLLLGQLLTLDMGLTCYLTLSLTAFLEGQRAPPGAGSRAFMLLAWAAGALGVLSKGVVAAAIPATVLVLYSLIRRDWTPWRRLQVPMGLPLFLALCVPWHWLAARRLDDFLDFYFVHEHLARYLTPEAQRVQPWWFFIAVFLGGSVPFTLPAVRVVVSGFRRAGPEGFDESLFLWVWVVFVGVFFSLSDSKLIPYLLPAFPALAMLIARLPDDQLRRDLKLTALMSALIGILAALASARWPQLVPSGLRGTYFLPLGKSLALFAALVGLSGALLLAQGAREVTRSSILLGSGWCLAVLTLMRAAAAVAPIYSGLPLAAALPGEAVQAPVYCVGTYDQTLPFYLQRPVRLVHFRGELDYGLKRDPSVEIPDLAAFGREWAGAGQAFAIMESSMFDQLTKQGAPMRLLRRANERVLVARR
jgi:4-amino-4-deoxy-L-arabinose transferase-like glycosyltransferase